VDFGSPAIGNQPLRLTSYYTQLAIPTTLDLPCRGTGTVQFVPSPTDKDAVTAVLEVSYEGTGI
jgi:hypothetical protein